MLPQLPALEWLCVPKDAIPSHALEHPQKCPRLTGHSENQQQDTQQATRALGRDDLLAAIDERNQQRKSLVRRDVGWEDFRLVGAAERLE